MCYKNPTLRTNIDPGEPAESDQEELRKHSRTPGSGIERQSPKIGDVCSS